MQTSKSIRPDFFTAIHKGVSSMLFELSLAAGRVDPSSLADVDGVFRVIVTYADKSTRTFAICEGELAESHAFPTNTLALTIRSHGGDTVANL